MPWSLRVCALLPVWHVSEMLPLMIDQASRGRPGPLPLLLFVRGCWCAACTAKPLYPVPGNRPGHACTLQVPLKFDSAITELTNLAKKVGRTCAVVALARSLAGMAGDSPGEEGGLATARGWSGC